MNRFLPFLSLCLLTACSRQQEQNTRQYSGTYEHQETSFTLTSLTGNPFDFTENDVNAVFQRPDGVMATIPAFYDGNGKWRARFTPTTPGRHTLAGITHNGRPVAAVITGPKEFTVTGAPDTGFVRLNPEDKTRFAFDNGTSYYPVGYNIGWGDKSSTVPAYLEKLGAAGLTWSRIWMCAFDDRSLDWSRNEPLPPGQLDLTAARKWDDIVDAAEKNKIYFQLVLQHHGQYSTNTNPNWPEHPWNKKNGGWLAEPADFFTDQQAISLTKLRYHYILARWGYSPNIMAWELFNEVEHTDAMQRRQFEAVTTWHKMMIEFIRKHDPYHHLVTSSSMTHNQSVLGSIDYHQPHSYPSDPAPTLLSLDERKWKGPYFLGEIGPGVSEMDDPVFVHRALWASMASGSAGTAQYWYWDRMEPKNLHGFFAQVATFVRKSGLDSAINMRRLNIEMNTTHSGPLAFRTGGGWEPGGTNAATILTNGRTPGAEMMPRYLHGGLRPEFMTNLEFNVDYPQAGDFTVEIQAISTLGAHLAIALDGTVVADQALQTTELMFSNTFVTISIPAGPHTITLKNGASSDWLLLGDITLTPYAPLLGAIGKANDDFAIVWIYRRDASALNNSKTLDGTTSIRGLKSGTYTATWHDTISNRHKAELTVTVENNKPLALTTPLITDDVALVLKRAK